MIEKGCITCHHGEVAVESRCTHGEDTRARAGIARARSPLLLSYFKEIGLEKEIRAYLEMRKEMGKPVNTKLKMTRLVNKHKRLVEDGHDPAAIILQSTRELWESFYEVRDNENSTRSGGRTGQKLTPVEQQKQAAKEYFAGT